MDHRDVIVSAFRDLHENLVEGITGKDNRKREKINSAAYKKGLYPYIPFSDTTFIEVMLEIREICRLITDNYRRRSMYLQPRFLEVGCGFGLKLLLAQQMGFNTTGIEINKRYISVAKTVSPDAKIHQGNALDFSYSGYDVIYMYCPFEDYKKEHELELKILRECSRHTIVYFANSGTLRWMADRDGVGKYQSVVDKFQTWSLDSYLYSSMFIKTTKEKFAHLYKLREEQLKSERPDDKKSTTL